MSKCKVVFLGSAGTGKTSLIQQFVSNKFDNNYQVTLGIDFFTKPIQVQDKTVNLQIWDTAGQERFRSLIPSYIRDSQIAILVYDVSSFESFEEAIQWHKTVLNERGNDSICIFVGNKNDLENKVSHEKVLEYTKPFGITSIETSAKTGQNITRLFKIIGESIPDTSKPVSINITPQPIEIIPQINQKQCQC